MDSFSFIFSFYGLILGLALTELLGGFGKAFQSRKKIKLGRLAPILGLAVALDLTSFWIAAWFIRRLIPLNYLALMFGLIVTGLYYLIARITFPDEPAEWPDYDLYYFEHRRLVLGGVIICNVLVNVADIALGMPIGSWLTWLPFAMQMVFSAVAMTARNRAANLVALILLALLYPGWPIGQMLLG